MSCPARRNNVSWTTPPLTASRAVTLYVPSGKILANLKWLLASVVTVTSGNGPFAVTSTPAPAGVTPSGRNTVPERTPEIVLTSFRLKFTVWPAVEIAPCAPTCVGKNTCEALTPICPTCTLLNRKFPLRSVAIRCDEPCTSEHESWSKMLEVRAMSAPKAGVPSGASTFPVTVPVPTKRITPNPVVPSATIEAEALDTSNELDIATALTCPTGKPVKVTTPSVPVAFGSHPQA